MKRGWGAVAATLLVVGCGGGGGEELDLSSLRPPDSTTMTAPAVTTAAPSSVAAATTTTAFVDTQEWQPVAANLAGLSSECGNVMLTSFPDRDLIIAGIAQHGLFSATGGADAWLPLGTGGGDPVNNRMAGIVVDPERPDTWWESGNYGGGVFRTDDNGATFQQLGDLSHVDFMSVDVTDPARQTVLAVGHESTTVYRSTDGGATWSPTASLPPAVGSASAPLVIDASTYLVGTVKGPESGVFRTTDGGATWTKVSDDPTQGAPLVQGGKILWIIGGGGGLLVSTDGGVTWTANGGPGIAGTALQLVALPDGRVATLGPEHVIVTSDDGAHWAKVGKPFPGPRMGIGYSVGHDAFYVSRFDCAPGDNPVQPDSIVRLDLRG